AGRSLADSGLRRATGCTVVAVARGDEVEGNPPVHEPLPADGELVLIGDDDAERRFRERYQAALRPGRWHHAGDRGRRAAGGVTGARATAGWPGRTRATAPAWGATRRRCPAPCRRPGRWGARRPTGPGSVTPPRARAWPPRPPA